MSKASKSRLPVVDGVTAIMGDTFVLKKVGDQLMIKGKQKTRKTNSKKQQGSIDRFTRAQSYAKAVLERPGMKELYSKGITDKLKAAHQVAANDYLYAPEIHYVKLDQYRGKAGDVLRIKATDDFQVAEVKVRITNKRGLVEEGSALCYRRKAFMWLYKTTVANPDLKNTVIRVIAIDWATNDTRLEVTPSASSG